MFTYFVNAWIESATEPTMRAKVHCVHRHASIEEALLCPDAPLGAFLRRVDIGIERSLTDDDMLELRRCIKDARANVSRR